MYADLEYISVFGESNLSGFTFVPCNKLFLTEYLITVGSPENPDLPEAHLRASPSLLPI